MSYARTCAPVLAAIAALAGLVAALAGGHPTVAILTVTQTLGVGWLLVRSWRNPRGWANGGFICAAAWVPTFLVPSWIYTMNPGLLDIAPSPVDALALVNLSLFALIAGIEAFGGGGPSTGPTLRMAKVHTLPLRGNGIAAWFLLGLLSLATLFAVNGGPASYLHNLDQVGAMNAGLTYLIWGVLALKFASFTMLSNRWSRGLPATRAEIALVTAAVLLVGLLGARAFVAIALVELGLFYHLVRRPIPLGAVLAVTLLASVVVILGGGTLKRFQNYQSAHPGTRVSVFDYALRIAPSELPNAYANNYADGVRLIALAREVVPSQADYEYGKVILQTAVQPVPASLRPHVSSDPAIDGTFNPGNGNTYAMPMQAVAYLQFGPIGVLLTFLFVGFVLTRIDRRLLSPVESRLSTWLLLVALIANVPFLLRGGLPRGLAVGAIDVIGLWVVARTVERPAKVPAGVA
jgi:hypothetical protein